MPAISVKDGTRIDLDDMAPGASASMEQRAIVTLGVNWEKGMEGCWSVRTMRVVFMG